MLPVPVHPWTGQAVERDMTARKSWNADRTDDAAVTEHDVYGRAADIARRSGLSLGAWLNGVTDDAEGRTLPSGDRQANAPRHRSHSRRHEPWDRKREVEREPAAPRQNGRENVRFAKLFDRLAELAERVGSAEEQAQRALALAERQLQQADRSGLMSERHVSAFADTVDHVHSDLAAVEREARRAVRELIGETRDVGRDTPRDDPRLNAIVSAIQSVEARLDGISDRLARAQAAPAPLQDERLSKIESQLVSIAKQLSEASERPVPTISNDLSETVRQIARRQDELDSRERRFFADPGRDREETDTGSLDHIHQRLSELADQIAAGRRSSTLDERLADLPERVESLRRSMENTNSDVHIDRLFGEIRALGGKISEARRCGLDGTTLARMETQLSDIRAALSQGEFGEAVAQIKAANAKLDNLLPRQDIAALDALREDIAELRLQLQAGKSDVNAATPAAAPQFDELRERIDLLQSLLSRPNSASDAIEALSQRVEALMSRLQASDHDDALHRLIMDLRSRIEDLAAHPPAQSAFQAVEDRLLTIIDRIERAQASAPNGAEGLSEVETRLKRLTELLEMQRDSVPDERAMRSLEQYLNEFRRSAEGSDRKVAATLDSLNEAIHRLNDRFAETLAKTTEPAPMKQAAAKPGAAMPSAAMPAAATPPASPPERKGASKAGREAKPAPPPAEQSPLSAAREAAARAAELQRSQEMARADKSRSAQAIGDLDVPLEPGSGRPNGKASSSLPSLDVQKPLRVDDPVRAARAAIQKEMEESAKETKVGALRNAFISTLRRNRKADDSAKEQMVEDAAVTAALVEKAENKPRAPRNIGALAIRVGVVLSALVIVLSAARIVLSLGNSGSPAPSATEQPTGETERATPKSSSALEEPKRKPALAASENDSSDVKTTGSTQAAIVAAPPLPEGLTSQRLKLAIEAGDPRAYFDVATRLADGRNVTRDVEAAIPWFKRAAELRHAPSYYRLGNIYEKGLGPKRDINAAVAAYRKGAELGNRKSMHNLATLFAAGIASGSPDYDQAFPLFEQAAELGLVDSQFNLAVLLVNGLGAKQNLSEAYKWFAIAAQNGDREAAKKRDEVGGKLAGQALVDARLAAQNFRPKALAAAENEDTPPALLFEDNPLAAQEQNGVKATPNLGISVAPAARKS